MNNIFNHISESKNKIETILKRPPAKAGGRLRVLF